MTNYVTGSVGPKLSPAVLKELITSIKENLFLPFYVA